jgi:integrase
VVRADPVRLEQRRAYTRAHADGKWRSNGRQVKRRIGLKRVNGTRDGLTRRQAEAELRKLMAEVTAPRAVGERLTIAELGQRYMRDLERGGRKRTTIIAVKLALRVHLEPFFGERAINTIKPEDVDDLVALMEDKRLKAKSIRNYNGTLSALFNYARSRRRPLATSNPCEGVELPAVEERTEIRFLDLDEVEVLIANVPTTSYQQLDRVMFLTAAMTGLRQGELIALRWRDVDWPAGRIRVRQNYVRGEYGTPKSRRSSRSVPMADRVAGELERLFQASARQSDDDLVFADPNSGGPLHRTRVLDRFRAALTAARLDERRTFHDLRHTFGTRMAAAGVPMRTLQEWMGHRDIATTQIYADYAPSAHEAALVEAAFASGTAGMARIAN